MSKLKTLDNKLYNQLITVKILQAELSLSSNYKKKQIP